MDQINRDNNTLRKLRKECSQLDAVRKHRKHSNRSAFHVQASSVFLSLQKALHATCRSTHKASLYVRSLSQTEDLPTLEECCGANLRIVLHHTAPTDPDAPWICEETEVRLLQSSVGNATSPSEPKAGKSRVRFEVPARPKSTTASSSQAPVNATEIEDLCVSMTQIRHRECGNCIGYLTDAAIAKRHGLYRPENHIVDEKAVTTKSLGDVLTSHNSSGRLSTGDRRRLAAALAAMMLDLHDTPWLPNQWGNREVTFFQHKGLVLVDHPFISTTVPSPQTSPTSLGGAIAYFASSRPISNESLFALALVLIELCLDKPFEELLIPADLNSDGSKHPATEYSAALRLADKIDDEAGEQHANMIRACIRCTFDLKATSLEDSAFRNAVYDNVVAVLQEEADQSLALRDVDLSKTAARD